MLLAGIGLTGTKLGCGEGGCGACTVMVSSWEQKKLQHRAINACLCPLYAVEGMHVVTVEGALLWCSARSPTGRKHALMSLMERRNLLNARNLCLGRVKECLSDCSMSLEDVLPCSGPQTDLGLVPCAGIGNVREGLHPVQERLAMAHGSQVLTPCAV